jgi:alpha-glucosidase
MNGRAVLRHARSSPALRTGASRVSFRLFKGSFRIRDRTRLEAASFEGADEDGAGHIVLRFVGRGGRSFALDAAEEGGLLFIRVAASDPEGAFELSLPASPGERVFGCGERFTKLDLRGEVVRNWVEEHVGTVEAIRKVILLALGIKPRTRAFRHYATYFPQPTFVSSARYFCHVDCDAYGTLDFRRPDRHVIRFSEAPQRLVFGAGRDYAEVLAKLTGLLGRQAALPSWAYDGMILGIQGGTEACDSKARRLGEAGAAICGIWAQDWEGERITYFGKQLRWDYRWDEALYPGLPAKIREWQARGIAFLGYVNPYLCEDGALFAEAASKGYLALSPGGGPYLTKSTSFPFGIVDLSNPEAYGWLKSVVKENLIGLGLGGWMADFGEYLPADALLAGGSGADWHNRWPALWARLNREAVEESGASGRILPFLRSGYAGTARYATLMWNGDQHVDWSGDYGLGSVVRACLSLAMTGIGICHADVGGYTTLPRMKRSKELFLRWLELGAFMPVMRSHEGNRPWDNWQFDSDGETVAAVARWSRLHARLKPYLESAQREYLERGLPMMRPLFLHYEGDFGPDEDRAFLLGRDLAVYPVTEEGARVRRLRLPDDRWVGLFDGREYSGGELEAPAPMGSPPVFYRAGSAFVQLFRSLRS